MPITRRRFLHWAGAASLGFLGLRYMTGCSFDPESVYGPLVSDPKGVLNLPEGFSYTMFSETGTEMSDGLLVPGAHDGMAAFPGPNGHTIVMRNHEQNPSDVEASPFGERNELLKKTDASRLYDAGRGEHPCLGGVTKFVYDTRAKKLITEELVLAGTKRNCAGGRMPWGSWITCEEDVQTAEGSFEKAHGYNFEIPAATQGGLIEPIPLKEMGRFYHEAVAADPDTGIIYQTEDQEDGLFYRFLPNVKDQLAEGGKLQALKVAGMPSALLQNWENVAAEVGQELDVEWIDMKDVDPAEDDLRTRGHLAGAAQFTRGEGIWRGNGVFYFACTDGGPAEMGQIWEYNPKTETLRLFVEPTENDICESADNLTVCPWGDLMVCEDRAEARLIGVTPKGELYLFGHNVMNDSELAGVCFSPDGGTMFVNIQSPGMTLAITGPWKNRPA